MNNLDLPSIGFALSAIGYFAFWCLLLTVRARNTQRHLLAIFALLSVLSGVYYSTTSVLPYTNVWSFALESTIQSVTLLFFLSALSRPDISAWSFLKEKKISYVILVLASWFTFGLLVDINLSVKMLAAISFNVISLSILETLYRKSAEKRWQFKPMFLAFGINLLFDFYLLAEAALLEKIIPQTWMARGWIHVVTLPLLVISLNRIKQWGINVYISRDVVLQSSLLLGAGLYLCILAIAGYYIKYFGGNWTTLIQIVFFCAGATGLALLGFSTAIRRRIKVFIEKNFFANTFDYREKWVELTRQLNRVSLKETNTADICLQAMCKAIGYSNGMLVKYDQISDFDLCASRGTIAFAPHDSELLGRYIAAFKEKFFLIDVSDAHDQLTMKLCGSTQAITYDFELVIPISKGSKIWGFFLLKSAPNEYLKLNWELRDYLTAVTEQISSYLYMSEASEQLSENAQFVAFSRMSAFVVHDLKNVKAQIDMLLKNAVKHRHNEEFIDDVFTTIESMQSRLQNMLAQLTNKQVSGELVRNVDIRSLIENLIHERLSSALPLPRLIGSQHIEIQTDHEKLENILFHLIDNAQQATDNDGQIDIMLSKQGEYAEIQIQDTGCGMTDDFIKNRLFKPFDTTKGNAGMGIGAYDALTFAQQSGGQLKVQSKPGDGTTFTLLLPLKSIKP